MKIGKYALHVIETGEFSLDGGAMFGVVPKVLWQRTNPADEKNRIEMRARCLLLSSESEKILIDTGVGKHWNEKFQNIFNLRDNETMLEKSLQKIGLTNSDITKVILTHLHFDHTGGATELIDDKWVPTFPNAKYYLQKKQYEWGLNPSEKDGASYYKERYEPLLREGVLELLEGEKQLDEEIILIPTEGHTFSQQTVKISDGEKTVFYCADLIPTASHIPLPYIMSYDLFPMKTLAEKKEILPKAVEENWLLFFEHDPYCLATKVTRTDKGFSASERFTELPENI